MQRFLPPAPSGQHYHAWDEALPPRAFGSWGPAPGSGWPPSPSTPERLSNKASQAGHPQTARKRITAVLVRTASSSLHVWRCRRLLWHSPILPLVASADKKTNSVRSYNKLQRVHSPCCCLMLTAITWPVTSKSNAALLGYKPAQAQPGKGVLQVTHVRDPRGCNVNSAPTQCYGSWQRE